MVKAEISLYQEATTKIQVGSDYSDELLVKVGVHRGSVLPSFICNCI